MDPYIKITKKFTKKFGSKVINRQYFHRRTGLECLGSVAGPVILANGRLTFEDDLWSGGLLYFTTQSY